MVIGNSFTSKSNFEFGVTLLESVSRFKSFDLNSLFSVFVGLFEFLFF